MASWTPLDLSPDAWFDASDSDTITIDTGVSEWQDKSGNDRHVTQSFAAWQPALQAADLNGKDTIRFAGDMLSHPAFSNDLGYFTAFVVMKPDSEVSNGIVFARYNPTSSNRVGQYAEDYYNTLNTLINNSAGSGKQGRFTGTSTAWFQCVTVAQEDNQLKAYVDGVVGAMIGDLSPGPRVTALSTLDIGGGNSVSSITNPFNGNIAEVILFQRELSDTDRQQVEGYLAWKWGMEGNLPSGHPYETEWPFTDEAGPWTPADITTALWLDASDATTIDNPAAITEWRDKSGNGRHVVQTSSTLKPLVASAELNGLDVVRFNQDTLKSSAAAQLTNPTNGTWSAFVVCKSLYPSSYEGVVMQDIADASWGTPLTRIARFAFQGNGVMHANNFSDDETAQGDAWDVIDTTTDFYIWSSVVQSNGFINIWDTGTAGQTPGFNSYGNNINSGYFTIGGYEKPEGTPLSLFRGDIAEVIIVSSTLADEDRQMLEGYLAWKWGFQERLPIDHLYRSHAPGVPIPTTDIDVELETRAEISCTVEMGVNPTPIWTPDVIGPSLWLDASDHTTIVMEEDGDIVTWKDKSGKGFHVMRTYSENYSPTVVQGGLNGRDVVNFPMYTGLDGLPDGGGNLTRAVNGVTAFAIIQKNDSESGSAIFTAVVPSVSSTRPLFQLGINGASNITAYATRLSSEGTLGTSTYDAYTTGEFHQLGGSVNFATKEVKTSMDGVESASIGLTMSAGATEDDLSLHINVCSYGGLWDSDTSIAELVVFDRALSSEETAFVEGYLNWKWGLQANLDPGHPYYSAYPIKPADPPEGIPRALWTPALLETTRWYKAGDLDLDDGAKVSLWHDASGNDVNLFAHDNDYRPTFRTNEVNGNPSVFFDGAHGLQTRFPLNEVDSVGAIFVVIDHNAVEFAGRYPTGEIMSMKPGTTNYGWSIFKNTYLDCYYKHEGAGDCHFNFTSVYGTNLVEVTRNGLSAYIGQNGTIVGAYGMGNYYPIGYDYVKGFVGCRHADYTYNNQFFFTGSICEIIIVDHACDTTERQLIEGYLAHKYGSADRLPAAHPYKTDAPVTSPHSDIDVRLSTTQTLSSTVENYGDGKEPFDPWTPAEITTDLWFDAADGDSIETLAGGTISLWRDKSGNDHHGEPAGYGAFPTLSLGAINGKNAVTSSDDGVYFTLTNDANEVIYQADKISIFAVARKTDGYDTRYGLIVRFFYSTYSFVLTRIEDYSTCQISDYHKRLYNDSIIGVPTFPFATSEMGTLKNWRSLADWSLGESDIRLHGTLDGGVSDNLSIGTISTNYPYEGRIGGLVGDICEVILIRDRLTEPEEQQIEAYLAWKWGTEKQLPLDHPYREFAPGDSAPLPAWTPALISPFLWLDASDSSTITIDVGVSVWADKSENGRNAVQPIGANQPTVLVKNLNYFDTINFNGSSSFLDTVELFDTLAATGTFFIVYRTDIETARPLIGTKPDGASDDGWLLTADSSAILEYSHTSYSPDTDIPLASGYNIAGFKRDGLNVTPIVNGVDQSGVVFSGFGSSTLDLTRIGADAAAASFFDGAIAEIIAFDTVLSTEDQQYVEGYLAWKYDIAPLLPSSHPYFATKPRELPPDLTEYAWFDIVPQLPVVSSILVNESEAPWVFLLQSTDIDVGNIFNDSSLSNVPITAIGDANHSQANAKFGLSSIRTNTSSDVYGAEYDDGDGYLITDPSEHLILGDGDWTIDFWIDRDHTSSDGSIMHFMGGGGVGLDIWFEDGDLKVTASEGTALIHFTTGWKHIAVVKCGGEIQLYMDGDIDGSYAGPSSPVTDNTDYNADTLRIGYGASINLEDVRISKSPRWIQPFDVPTEEIPLAWRMISDKTVKAPSVSSTVFGYADLRTFTNCMPWRVQPFNTVDPIPEPYPSVVDGTAIPAQRGAGNVAVIGSKVYIIGGYKNAIDYELPMPGLIADINPDGTVGTWTEDTDFDSLVTGGETFRTSNRLYLVGGSHLANLNPDNEVIYYNIIDDVLLPEKNQAPSMRHTRQSFGLVVTRNRVYAIGGCGTTPEDTVEFSTIDAGENLGPWEWGYPLPVPIRFVTAVFTGTKIYAFGTTYRPETPDDAFDYKSYCFSADVDEYGVAGDWTQEWVQTNIYIKLGVVQTKNYLCLLTSSYEAGRWVPGYEENAWTIRKWPISAGGIIDFNSTEYTQIPFMEEIWDSAFFITSSKLYLVGGFTAVTGSGFVFNPAIRDIVQSLDFVGGENTYEQYNFLDEVTPVLIDGHVETPPVYVLSYFGDWRFLDVAIQPPIVGIDSVVANVSYINTEIEVLVPEIFTTVFRLRIIDTDYQAPIPEIFSYVLGLNAIDTEFIPSVAKVQSYLRMGTFVDMVTPSPVLESVVSCPVAIWGRMKIVHPHLNSSFQMIVDIHSYRPVISSIISNPKAMPVTFVTKVPVVNAVVANPCVYHGHINIKAPKLNSKIWVEGEVSFFTAPVPVISGSLNNPVPINVSIRTRPVQLQGYIPTPERAWGNYKVKAPTINSLTLVSMSIKGRFVEKVPVMSGRLENKINLQVNFNPQAPKIKSSTVLPTGFELIEYIRNRQCSL